MEDPDGKWADTARLFVDRKGESEALRNAVLAHRARLHHGPIDTEVLRNVLTFHGEGGVGKSELSLQLANWLRGGETIARQWGSAPKGISAVVRWDVNDSRGVLDALPLLGALRRQLGSIRGTWPAYDLAFGAFHWALRPGEQLRLNTPRPGVTTTLSAVFAALAEDATEALLDPGYKLPSSTGAFAFEFGRSILATAHAKSVARRTLRDHPTLEQLIVDCEAASGSVEQSSRLAGRIAFMLTQQIDRMAPPDRPLVVVFVDHMERLQVPGSKHLGEAVMNRLVTRLPYFLFVISGRNSLRWHVQNPELDVSGPRRWPLLVTDPSPREEPHQHLIGHLSPSDAELFLRDAFHAHGITAAPGLAQHIAATTDGWPLHLQTVVDVARERMVHGRPLTPADLRGEMPELVNRLLRDLPTQVADAFRAACLLPYFDIGLVAAAGNSRIGAVEQLLQRHLVRANEGSVYPYRIHDTLRALVREAGSAAAGGWGAADWARHAHLALAEAQVRFNQAIAAQDDLAAVHSLALGLNVATENAVFEDWLVDAVRRSPSIRGLAPLVAAAPAPATPGELVDLLQFLQLRSRALLEDVTDELLDVAERRTPVSSMAALWRVYDLRGRGRSDEALAQLTELLKFGDQQDIYHYQIGVTLRMGRRFADALERTVDMSAAQAESVRLAVRRMHGDYVGSSDVLERRVRSALSRRFQLELMSDWLLIRHRERGVTESEARDVHAAAVGAGHLPAQAASVGVLAELFLFDDLRFEACVAELEEICRRTQSHKTLATALAMRALALADDSLAQRAHERAALAGHRSSPWIATEILLEHLGHPLPPQANAQWLEPYDVVRRRWLGVLGRIVDRAHDSHR